MNQPIKVSIIIPVYQVENYLERAVDSAIAQTLPEKEIILVDDGSDDASPQICDRYAQEYPDLINVIHKENEGSGWPGTPVCGPPEGNSSLFSIQTTPSSQRCTRNCIRRPSNRTTTL